MDWHRLFGLLLMDAFSKTAFVVEPEKDMSVQKQLLDAAIIRTGVGPDPPSLPDGFEDLGTYNLLTFKSHQEALDDWALKEETAHYVSMRKLVSPSPDNLLPESDFRLFAVCARYPHNLASAVGLEMLRPGVYQCRRGTDVFRVVVLGRLPMEAHNSLGLLLSADKERVRYGAEHYRLRSDTASLLLADLFAGYQKEGLDMPITLEEYRQDALRRYLAELTPEERLAGLTPEQRLAGLTLEQRLAGLTPEQQQRLLAGLPPEQLQQFLAGLPAEQRQRMLAGLPHE